MRKFFLLLVFIAITGLSAAQETQEVYCEIVGRSTFSFTGKIKIEIDFGQENRMFKGFNTDILKDPVSGKPIRFNSMIDALNFMAQDGWTFVNAYNMTDSNNNIEYHYIMKKVVPKTE